MSNVWLCVDVENWCCNEKMRSAACSFGGEITAKLVEEWCGSGVHRRLGRIRVPNTRDYSIDNLVPKINGQSLGYGKQIDKGTREQKGNLNY